MIKNKIKKNVMVAALTPALSPRRGRNDFSVGCIVALTA
jgi:hypothetical protein